MTLNVINTLNSLREKMANETEKLKLLVSTGDEFFTVFEKYAKIVIPDPLKRYYRCVVMTEWQVSVNSMKAL